MIRYQYARPPTNTYIEITGPETVTMQKQTFPVVHFFTPLNNYLEEALEFLMYFVLRTELLPCMGTWCTVYIAASLNK